MTDCKSFLDRLALMALNELSEKETEAVDQHLAVCVSCTEYLRELQEVTLRLAPPSSGEITELEKLLIEGALYRRLADSSTSTSVPGWMGISLRIAAALALFALGYVGGIFSTQNQTRPSDPLPIERQLARINYDKDIASFRLSSEGLRLIARGREGLISN